MSGNGTSPTRLVWLHPKLDKPMGGANFVYSTAIAFKRFAPVLVIGQQVADMIRDRFEDASVPLVSLDSPTYTNLDFWMRHGFNLRRDTEAIRRLLEPGDVIVTSMYPMNLIASRLGRHDLGMIYEPFSNLSGPWCGRPVRMSQTGIRGWASA